MNGSRALVQTLPGVFGICGTRRRKTTPHVCVVKCAWRVGPGEGSWSWWSNGCVPLYICPGNRSPRYGSVAQCSHVEGSGFGLAPVWPSYAPRGVSDGFRPPCGELFYNDRRPSALWGPTRPEIERETRRREERNSGGREGGRERERERKCLVWGVGVDSSWGAWVSARCWICVEVEIAWPGGACRPSDSIRARKFTRPVPKDRAQVEKKGLCVVRPRWGSRSSFLVVFGRGPMATEVDPGQRR